MRRVLLNPAFGTLQMMAIAAFGRVIVASVETHTSGPRGRMLHGRRPRHGALPVQSSCSASMMALRTSSASQGLPMVRMRDPGSNAGSVEGLQVTTTMMAG